MNRRGSRRWRWPARLAAVAGSGVVLAWVLGRLDRAALLEALRSMRVGWYLGAIAVFGLGLLTSAIRWHLMLRLNPRAVVHGAASVRMVFISQLFNTFLGGPAAGDIPKTALYSRWFGVPVSDVLAASVLDRLVASLGGVAFAMAALTVGWLTGGFAFLANWQWRLPGGWMVAGGAGLVGLVAGVVAWGWWRPDSFVGRSLGALRQSVRRLAGSSRRSGHAFTCAVMTALLFNLTQVFCLEAVAETRVPWTNLFWMYHAITLVATLPVTVAGTGIREGASMMLLSQYGVPAPTAVAAAMLTLSVHLFWSGVGAVLLWRERRHRRGVARPVAMPTVSAVIPVLNEAEALAGTVGCLRAIPEIGEVLVVDGGSTDATVEVARSLGCQVVESRRGRGAQMGVGARAATGSVVLFVHADTWLSPEAGPALIRCLRDPLVVGGGFWKRFRSAPWLMRGSRFRCWLRLWWSGRILGDQAVFVRREVLEAVGGVPDQPLMEEVELCRRLRRKGRLALAGAAVSTSERRFRKHGYLRTYWRMWRVTRAYRRGVPAEELERIYEGRS